MGRLLKHALIRIGSSLLLLLVFCGGVVGLAQAQTGPSVFLTPESANIVINGATNTVEIDLLTEDAVDVQGYELYLDYDSEILQLQSWIIGSFLPSSVKLIEENTPGYLRVVIIKLGPPPISGDGQLLRLTFKGVAPGMATLTVTNAIFTHPIGGKTYPQIVNNTSITTAYDPDLLPKFSLTGSVSLQGQSNPADADVQLEPGTTYQIGPYIATSTGNPGANLNFGQVVADTYAITTDVPRYLNLTESLGKTVSVSAGKTSLNLLWLRGGNAVWTDNVIDEGDASLVGASFGMTTADLAPGETLDADVNFDGVVNLRDLALVAGNYDLTAAAAYADWTP